MKIDEIKTLVQSLSHEERRKLLSDLILENYEKGDILSRSLSKIESEKATVCPHCQSDKIWGRGSYKGVRKYHCLSCNKYFSSTTGTALFHIHKKDKWQHYIQCMERGLTIKKSATEVGISIQTAFDWRHKILSSISDLEPKKLGGITEADEFYLMYSEKGKRDLKRKPRKRGREGKLTDKDKKVSVVTAADRRGHKIAKVAGKGTLKREELAKSLSGKFDKDTLLCSDSAKVYKGLAQKEGIEHLFVSKLGRPTQKNKAYHIQTVNRLHRDIREFLYPFNGVSTKYLQNYLYWHLAVSKNLTLTDKIKLWIWLSITMADALNTLQELKENAL